MGFTRWKDIAELIGLAAIVGSLVFVGLQMKQSQDIALATQYQARAQATMELALAHLEADYVGPIPLLRAGVNEEITAADINTYLWLWIHMDNHYYQYEHGFMSEDAWQAQLRNIKGIYADCGLRFVYDWRKGGLRDEFVALVDSLGDPCVSANE